VQQALTSIEHLVIPTPQSGTSTNAPKITKDDAKIGFDLPATKVLQKIKPLPMNGGLDVV
jgi:methionyl-tRNA formyltransferase